ncbi:MAG: LptF/LptG family permease [Bacteroidales bacterium]|nr:LptF/LptG family permease [Bacteroidales bacterium]MCB9013171.1 LptF/LptG family permease [Bacteroidales bacterium]
MEKQHDKKLSHKIIEALGLKIIDLYIIKKFLGTFVYSIVLILALAVIFDLSEKIDDFIESSAPVKEVVFEYYLNFIPYFAVLFSALFTFISVIFFTSKMAYNTEIIAILSSGVSFRRMLLPYFISASIIAFFAFMLSNFVIPKANKTKLEFEEKYIHKRPQTYTRKNIHKQIEPGVFVYLESYSTVSNTGYNFSIEKFENGKLISKTMADQIVWDTASLDWRMRRYYTRDFNGLQEKITEGNTKDTSIRLDPADFSRRLNAVEAMSYNELNEFISVSRMQGETNLVAYLIEKYKRTAFPFSTFILTLIGVTVSSRKVRGGIGAQLGLGLGISFGYILFMQFSSQFAIGGSLPPLLAVWLPNLIFAVVALFLYRFAPK